MRLVEQRDDVQPNDRTTKILESIFSSNQFFTTTLLTMNLYEHTIDVYNYKPDIKYLGLNVSLDGQ